MVDKVLIVSDNSVNSYGFRVLSEGGNFSRFLKNPIGFLDHMCDSCDDENYSGPIVKWKDLKVENGQITAIPEFDTNDPKGALVASKFENGFLNTASIGFNPIEVSTDPALMLPGQTGPTVTKWDLIEISVASIPSNENSCALFDESGKRIELKSMNDFLVKLSATSQPKNNLKNSMKKITLKAGLVALAKLMGFKETEVLTDTEVDFTPEMQVELNDKLLLVDTLTADKQSLTEQLNAKTTELTNKTNEYNTLNAELERIKKLPAVSETLKKEAGKGANITEENKDVVDALSFAHEKAADAMLGI